MNGESVDPWALRIAYDGTELAGWQLQPKSPTVQGLIEEALAKIHGVPGRGAAVVGSGRTDAGVHALGQIASYRPPTPRSAETLMAGLAALLPESVRVLGVAPMPPDFHACRSAIGKLYRYRIVRRPVMLPFEARWAWHLRGPLDVAAMREAAATLVGRHDFASFATSGGQSKTSVRTMTRLELLERDDGVLDIAAEADGFLYRMVRNIVGMLAEVGLGRRPASDAAAILAAESRSAAGMTAPARGLCLVRAHFPERFSIP